MEVKSLTAFEAVLAVAQTGNFVKAAQALGISSAAISKSIARLEQEMGVKLFQRTTRVVSTTIEGERLVAGLRPLMNELVTLTNEVADYSSAPAGNLRLSLPPNLGRYMFMPLVNEFLTQHPDMSLDISLDPKLSNLIEDKIDIAVRAGVLPDNANLVARPVMQPRLLLCASPQYIERFGTPASVEDLVDHKAVLMRRANKQIEHQWQLTNDISVATPPSRLVVDDFDALLSGVKQGIGIGRLFDFMCNDAVRKGELIVLFPELKATPTVLNAIYQDRRMVSPRIRAMVDFLVAKLGTIT
jgi:DNA-binding transcriptional LysR family regulator